VASGIRRVSWSASEITALATKAARGAGAPPEQAARFGTVAAFHLGAGRAPQDLIAAVESLPGGPIVTLPGLLDAVVAEAWDGVTDPCVLPPDHAALARSYVAVLPYDARCTVLADGGLSVMLDISELKSAKATGRIAGCDVLIARFSELAARTFVPESEASRSKGAGAGLSDND
jgi:hypothetical protein